MLFAIVSTSSALDGTRGTTHSTTMDLISEIQLGPRSRFGLYQDPVSKAALLDPNLDSNGPLDQIRQEVDLGFAALSCRNRDHQGKFNFFLALSKSVLYPVEDWVCDDHQRHKLFCLDLVEGFHGLFLRFDDPRVFDPAESEVNTRLFVGHDSYLAHVCFLLEDQPVSLDQKSRSSSAIGMPMSAANRRSFSSISKYRFLVMDSGTSGMTSSRARFRRMCRSRIANSSPSPMFRRKWLASL